MKELLKLQSNDSNQRPKVQLHKKAIIPNKQAM